MGLDVNMMVGGEAGQGVQSVGFILAKALARGGYHVFADQDYESRIRGGHNFYRVRISDDQVGAISEHLDMLIALNRESVTLHQGELKDAGVAIFDAEKIKDISPNGMVSSSAYPWKGWLRKRRGIRL
jgi:2-oxoglutarate ferredoxin oxidoreductase subunit alpha